MNYCKDLKKVQCDAYLNVILKEFEMLNNRIASRGDLENLLMYYEYIKHDVELFNKKFSSDPRLLKVQQQAGIELCAIIARALDEASKNIHTLKDITYVKNFMHTINGYTRAPERSAFCSGLAGASAQTSIRRILTTLTSNSASPASREAALPYCKRKEARHVQASAYPELSLTASATTINPNVVA